MLQGFFLYILNHYFHMEDEFFNFKNILKM
jgi:hypothetical protein